MATILSAIAGILGAIFGIWKLIDGYVSKSPEDKSKEFNGDLNDAFKKAQDPKDPDPSDLSKLINR